MKHLLVTFIIFIALQSCSRVTQYEKYRVVEGREWNHDELLFFDFELNQADYYNLYLTIRHGNDYPASNLWIRLYEVAPNGDSTWTRYDIEIAYPDGRWTGSRLGNIIQHRVLLRHNTKFTQSGTYNFILQHDMRNDPVRDVLEMGLKIDRLN